MSKRKHMTYLKDILESTDYIIEFIKNMDYDEFLIDRKTRDAIIRNLEIIGEASKNIPDDIKFKYPDVPWKEMSGMRDKMIHGYFDIIYSIVWTTATEDIPHLNKLIKIIISNEK